LRARLEGLVIVTGAHATCRERSPAGPSACRMHATVARAREPRRDRHFRTRHSATGAAGDRARLRVLLRSHCLLRHLAPSGPGRQPPYAAGTVYADYVIPDSPAHHAGLQAGDHITRLGPVYWRSRLESLKVAVLNTATSKPIHPRDVVGRVLRSIAAWTGALAGGLGVAVPMLAGMYYEMKFGRPSSTAGLALPVAVIGGRLPRPSERWSEEQSTALWREPNGPRRRTAAPGLSC
jgi:hypothetical protein